MIRKALLPVSRTVSLRGSGPDELLRHMAVWQRDVDFVRLAHYTTSLRLCYR